MKLTSKARTTSVSDQVLMQAILRQDLAAFIVKVFQTLRPADPYLRTQVS
jgi:hypothetical protein